MNISVSINNNFKVAVFNFFDQLSITKKMIDNRPLTTYFYRQSNKFEIFP
jgi:hypothetical protein